MSRAAFYFRFVQVVMIVSVLNKKGGTGKTTSSINIGRAFAIKGKKVLLIDLDPQGNLSYSLGIHPEECFVGKALENTQIRDSYLFKVEDMDVLPSDNELIHYEYEFIQRKYPFELLKQTLSIVSERYDYVIIDCPPSAGYLTINALIASQSVLIPMQMDVLSLKGLEQLTVTVEEIKQNYNPELYILGVVGVMVDTRKQLTKEISDYIKNGFEVTLLDNFVRQNVKAAEAPSHGLSIIEYAPKSNSARDYLKLADELLLLTN